MTVTLEAHGNHDDVEYDGWIERIQSRFMLNCNNGIEPVFQTATESGTDTIGDQVWAAYLYFFSDLAERQYHNCHACRQFIQRFGTLVTIGPDGKTRPAIWDEDDAPDAYKLAVAGMARLVRRAKVTGPFLSSDLTWGTPVTGQWHHYAVRPAPSMVYPKSRLLTAGQAMAEKRQDFIAVSRALADFKAPDLGMAVTLLKTDALYRSEKVLGQAEWLYALLAACDAVPSTTRFPVGNQRRANVIWRAVATAPAGFCHPRSGMIGTLLEDIAAGKPYDEVERAFAAKMHPLRYQRPQAAASAGAIAAAEKVIAQLDAAGSLARRFCRLDEVLALWRPHGVAKPTPVPGGVFGHLKPKADTPESTLAIPSQTMTWEKFERTVLPTAERIQILTPARGPYSPLVTAANMEAPPILQWDSLEVRNPVSWYFRHNGSLASDFGLPPRQWCDVDAVTLKPSMWYGNEHPHQGNGVMFVIAGARESRSAGAALFPETMRSEFHGIRSVIEQYSASADIAGRDEPHAAGLLYCNREIGAQLRVWSGGRSLDYLLDRWD